MPARVAPPTFNSFRRSAHTVRLLSLVLLLSIALAITSFAVIWADESNGPRLVCLMYHRFVTDEEYSSLSADERLYAIPIRRFDEQLRSLRERGYQAIRVEDGIAFARGEKPLPEKSVLITIDDGYRCTLVRAQPILTQHGFRAALFVTTDSDADIFDHAGRTPLSAADLRRLDPDVIEVFAHGATHRPLRDLPDDAIRRELSESRATLEKRLGHPIPAMAVPGNWYDDRVVELAREVGYVAVFTSDPGSIHPGSDLFRLPRWNVAGSVKPRRLTAMLEPFAMARRRFAWTFSHALRGVLGETLGAPVARGLAALSQTTLRSPQTAGLALALSLGLLAAVPGIRGLRWACSRA